MRQIVCIYAKGAFVMSSDLEWMCCFLFEMKGGEKDGAKNVRCFRWNRKLIIIVCVTGRGGSEVPLCILKARC